MVVRGLALQMAKKGTIDVMHVAASEPRTWADDEVSTGRQNAWPTPGVRGCRGGASQREVGCPLPSIPGDAARRRGDCGQA